jgi:hypothetical protein
MISQTNYVLKLEDTNYVLAMEKNDYNIKLARTGGQGSRGHSISNVSLAANGSLLVGISDAAGNLLETVNAGSVSDLVEAVDLSNLATTQDLQTGDILVYDSLDTKWKNHSLTTTSMSDVDNTNKADGALLVYNASSSKYTATKTLSNQNTTITGGSF